MTHPKQPESNGLAVASLVLGILSLTSASILTGIPAIITGAMGLKNPATKNMSMAGIIMGAISVVFAVLAALFFVFMLFVIIATEGVDTETTPSLDAPSSEYWQRRT